jgi:hypothetical protein
MTLPALRAKCIWIWSYNVVVTPQHGVIFVHIARVSITTRGDLTSAPEK